ncbi:MAG: hypothetical protein IPO09_08185 [Anaeromyxobacter sp.]|nr:hypothetical protein [Anaeromyxobacter sp.]MBL0277779.1 hypothetical protein [Anaeromyxobacter sp.]
MRYLVRDRDGRELTVPSLADLAALHRQGFLGDEDLVRRETSARWERVADLAALGATRGRQRTRDLRWVVAVLFAAVTLVAALALLRLARGP